MLPSRGNSSSSSSKNKKAVVQWCSDALHDLLGFTDAALAAYLVTVARSSAQSPSDILKVLKEGGVGNAVDSSKQLLFCRDLFHRARGTSATTTTTTTNQLPSSPQFVSQQQQQQQQQQRKTNADWVKAAASYELVDDDDGPAVKGKKEKKKKRSSTTERVDNDKYNDVSQSPRPPKNVSTKDSNPFEESADKDVRKPGKKKRRYRRDEEDNSSSSNDDSQSHGSSERGGGVQHYRRKAEKRREKRRLEKHGYEYDENREGEKANEEADFKRTEIESMSHLTPEERAELERENDLKERDEFIKRMLERDKSKTKQNIKSEKDDDEAAEQKRSNLEEMLARGEKVFDESTGEEITLDRLREESRRVYLKKREERELELLKQSLKDEEELFQGQKLTDAEKKRLALGKQILEMVEDRDGKSEDKNDGFYRLPDEIDENQDTAKRNQALLTARYIDPKLEKSEQELWEDAQTQKAAAISTRKKKESLADQYELVFEDQIDFVMQETSKGYDKREEVHKKKEEIEVKKEVDSGLSEHAKILAGRKKLPVYPYREEFLAAVQDHQVLILVGETGSGKTTQIPQFLHEVGYSELGKIGCTQPRRVAAMSVSARVAQEMDVRLGHEVGYSIRFENCTSPKTIIQYMTDGMLLREILTEPDLASYSCMVIDEAHERTLHTDILFGLVKDIVRFRTDLKLIVSSATLDAEKFSKYFDDASIFMIPGRMYPVDIYYTKSPEADFVDAAVVTVLQIHVSQPLNGDILVFLTGQEEIETAAEILIQRSRNLDSRISELIICPIYANLPSEQQAKIFEKTPKGSRKVVLATNIAETSLTIDGICYVIDTGFNKQKSYNAKSGMESLVVTPISQAAANQRAGRAGRTQPGKCFRLYTAWSFQHELEPNTVPEILRTNMGNVVLMLKSLGINDLLHFDFMDRPPADALIKALEQLYALGALNDRGELTKLGRKMAEFPLDPMLSKAVVASEKYRCTSEVLSTVSMLSLGASVFYRPKEKAVHADAARLNFARGGGGDHIALLRCYSEWASTDYNQTWCFENYVQLRSMKKARDIREQLEGLCERVEIDHNVSNAEDTDSTLKAVTAGYFYNIVKLGRTGEYQTVKQKKTVYIHPSSVLAKDEEPPPWLVYFELAFTTKEYMRQVAPIQPAWLIEIAPHYYQESDVEDAKAKKMPKSRYKT